jgi:hypothetical protein
MKRLLQSLLDWFDHAESRDLERYLAQSANPADLERRMRDWERHHRGALGF